VSEAAGTLSGVKPIDVVRAYWERTQARDWTGVTELLDPELEVFWPVSRELFTGREAFVAMNATYPEGWSIRILSLLADDDRVVSEVEVPHVDEVFRAVSLWVVMDGRISSGTEYWSAYGGDEVPEWRRPFVTVTDR
jgi:hypothetical protein